MARTEEEEEPQHDQHELQEYGHEENLEHNQPEAEGGVIARQGTTHPYFTLLLHALWDASNLNFSSKEWACHQTEKKSRWWDETQSEGSFAYFWDFAICASSWNLRGSRIWDGTVRRALSALWTPK